MDKLKRGIVVSKEKLTIKKVVNSINGHIEYSKEVKEDLSIMIGKLIKQITDEIINKYIK